MVIERAQEVWWKEDRRQHGFKFGHLVGGELNIVGQQVGECRVEFLQVFAITTPVQRLLLTSPRLAAEKWSDDVLERLCDHRTFHGVKSEIASEASNVGHHRAVRNTKVPRQPVNAAIDVAGRAGGDTKAGGLASIIKVRATFANNLWSRIKNRNVGD